MKRYGEKFELTEEVLDTIVSCMDDDKRECVHFELAPCKPEEFFKKVFRTRFRF